MAIAALVKPQSRDLEQGSQFLQDTYQVDDLLHVVDGLALPSSAPMHVVCDSSAT